MKKTFSILLILFISINLFAQKVDLDRSYQVYTYTSTPQMPLPIEYKTYNVSATVTGATATYQGVETVEGKVNLQGFERKAKTDKVDLSVFINVGDMIINSTEVKERVDISKDRDGKETGRKYYYWVEMIYNFPTTGKVINNITGKEIYSRPFADSRDYYKSNEFGTREAAANYANNNRAEIKGQLIVEKVNSYTNSLSSEITNLFGYKTVKGNYVFWSQGEKKHPEYEPNSKIFEQLKTCLEKIKPNQPITPEIRESFVPVINYFNDVKVRFNKDEKGDKKMRYSAFYNLGYIYYFLENWDEANKEAEGLIANDYDKSDGKQITKMVTDAQNSLKTANMTSRHFINLRVPAVVN